MGDITLVEPWRNISVDTDVVPLVKAQIDTLPLFNDCCIVDAQSPYYQSGDPVTDYWQLIYRFNKYNVNLRSAFFYSDRYNTAGLITLSDASIWATPVSVKDYNYTYYTQFANLKYLQMYLAKSSNTNGFWHYYFMNPYYYSTKVFLTKMIDENTGIEAYNPVIARHYTNGNTDNFCKVYPLGLEVDVKSYSTCKPGHSGTYVIRQLRVSNFLYPDVYIISGGMNRTEQNMVNIDNHRYIHLTNDLFIKID